MDEAVLLSTSNKAEARAFFFGKKGVAEDGGRGQEMWAPMHASARGWSDADSVFFMLSQDAQISGLNKAGLEEGQLQKLEQQGQQQQQGQPIVVSGEKGTGLEATINAIVEQLVKATEGNQGRQGLVEGEQAQTGSEGSVQQDQGNRRGGKSAK